MGNLKRLLAIFSIVFLYGYIGSCIAGQQASESSGNKTAAAVIYAGPCLLTGIDINTDGVNTGAVVLYDNSATSSGTVLFTASASTSGSGHYSKTWPFPVRAYNGLYVDFSATTNFSVNVEFIRD